MAAGIAINVSFQTAGVREAREVVQSLGDVASSSSRAAVSVDKLDRSKQQLAQSEIRVALASRDYSRATDLVVRQLKQNEIGTVRYNNLLAQQATIANRAKAAQEAFGRGTKSARDEIIGIAKDFGLAALAAGSFTAALNFAVEGFRLTAEIDQNRRALGVFVGSQERGNQIMAEAIRFGEKYGFTQREISQATREAGVILKNSTGSVEEVLTALGRLAAIRPEEGIKGAAFALNELRTGDITSIVERFGFARDAAYRLRDAIQSGTETSAALTAELNRQGLSADALTQRLEGPNGALLRYEQATERAKLASGNFLIAIGAPEALEFFAELLENAAIGADYLKNGIVGATNAMVKKLGLTRELTGALSQTADSIIVTSDELSLFITAMGGATFATQVQTDATNQLTGEMQKNILTSLEAEARNAVLAEAKFQTAEAAKRLEQGMYNEAQAATFLSAQLNITVEEAKRLLNIQLQLNDAARAFNARSLGESLGKTVSRGAVQSVKDYTREIEAANRKAETAANKAARAADKAFKAEQKDLRELEKARDDLRSDREKLAARQSELAGTTDETRKLQLEKEILDLQEKIADATEREAQAAIDAQLARLADSKLRRQEQKDLQQAQRVLNSSSSSADQRRAAQERILEIELQRQKRQQEIAEKQRQAGQSTGAIPGRPAGTPQGAIPGGPQGTAPTASAATGGASVPPVLVQFILDSQVIAEALVDGSQREMIQSLSGAFQQAMGAGALGKKG